MVMLNYCVVKQRIGAIVEDSSTDADRYPDYTQVSGDVTFTPVLAQGRSYQIVDSKGVTHTVPALRIRADIVNGEIFHEGEAGVPLFAAGPGSNPDTIAYTVSYSNLTAGSLPVSLNSVSFVAIPGATIDLATVTPIAGTPGVGITKGDKGDPFTYDDFTEAQLEDLIQQITVEVLAIIGGGTIPWPDPDPVDPDPVDPDPVDPDPDPVDPDPVDPDPVDPDPDPVDPDPDPTEVEAPAPSWIDNSDGGGGMWTTPAVAGVKYNPASGTATPGQTVTVTATALEGYVLLGATEWTHTFPGEPEPEPDDDPHSYSFTIREDTAPVNDRKQIYALTAEQWSALSYLRDQTASHTDPLGALNVALRSEAAEIVGVTSVTERALVEVGGTNLGKVRTAWMPSRGPAYHSFVADIGPVIDEISTKGVLI